jgi:hypothetical protein
VPATGGQAPVYLAARAAPAGGHVVVLEQAQGAGAGAQSATGTEGPGSGKKGGDGDVVDADFKEV